MCQSWFAAFETGGSLDTYFRHIISMWRARSQVCIYSFNVLSLHLIALVWNAPKEPITIWVESGSQDVADIVQSKNR